MMKSQSRNRNEVDISKTLSYILRHDPKGLRMRPDGYVVLGELLRLPALRGVTPETIHRVVADNSKMRFSITVIGDTEYIRANQGHSISVVDQEQLLTRVTDPTLITPCIHGTYSKNMGDILRTGLKPMGRTNIHFANGLPHQVKSGMRRDCNVLIYIDVEKAMKDGCPFYVSSNDVILSPGFGDSKTIPPEYFLDVQYR
jgi:RNA:NAD 2'-phosphotransferase (TPT1/KptA family)